MCQSLLGPAKPGQKSVRQRTSPILPYMHVEVLSWVLDRVLRTRLDTGLI